METTKLRKIERMLEKAERQIERIRKELVLAESSGETFSIGDRAIVTVAGPHCFNKGESVEVTYIDEKDSWNMPYCCKDKKGHVQWLRADQIKKEVC